MNKIFKRPNLINTIRKSSIAKDILMTFIGTTISIILTFGTTKIYIYNHI